MYKVKNNESGNIREFKTMQEAIKYQEYLVFVLGIDAEITVEEPKVEEKAEEKKEEAQPLEVVEPKVVIKVSDSYEEIRVKTGI